MSRTAISLISRLAVIAAVVAVAGGARAQAGAASDPGPGLLGDHFFHVQYRAEPRRGGESRITGYVYNGYGQLAVNVALEITAVDAGGRPVASMTQPVTGLVPGNGRARFDARVPEAASYRVSVSAFDLVEFGDNGA